MSERTFVDVLRRRASAQAGCRAYTYLVDGETEEKHLTFDELDRRARSVAAHLQSQGLAGERALLIYPPGLDYLAGFFGCLYAGVVAVPTHPPRLSRSNSRLDSIIADARVAVALTTSELIAGLEKRSDSLRWLATDTADDCSAEWREPEIGAETLALLQYTSGSTAVPKGVMVSHGNLLHNQALIHRAFPQPEDAVGLGWLPPYHDMGLIGQVLQPLYMGRPCVFLAPGAFLQKPVRWLQAMTRYGATGSGAPNFGYQMCVETVTPEDRQELDLRRWSVAFNGAEPIRPETLERFAATFAECGFRREAFFPCYGLAEATLMVSGAKRGSAGPVVRMPEGDGGQVMTGSGLVLTEQRVAIVDPLSHAELPAGQTGEIWVSGPSVAQGYWGKDDETEQTFHARLDTGDGPFLRTGDLGLIVDGELFVTGRIKDLIIIRGRNHYPHDIEWTMQTSHPDLLAGGGAAFSVEVEGEERLVLLQEVHRHGLRGLDVDRVSEAIRQAVTEVHEIAVYAVVLVRPFTLPKTSSGKIQRHLCRAAFLEAALKVVGEWRQPAAPRSPDVPADAGRQLRSWLVERVAAQLGVDPRSVDVHAPFAHLGLDSARLVAISGELETRTGRRLDPTLLYEHPTIEALAHYLEGGSAPAAEAAVPSSESFAIVGMACRFPGAENVDAFWELLRNGTDAITEVPVERRTLTSWPEQSGVRWGGFLSGVERFDPAFFGLGGREAAHVDPQQRLLLEVAWEALDDAGWPDSDGAARTGVFVGISTYDYGRMQAGDTAAIEAYSGPGCALSVAANRISYTFDLRGPSLAVDTACSSSLVALHLACRSLESGECDRALVGGVNLMLLPDVGVSYARAGNLAGDGRCKAFDARADGFVRGEGAGCVVLRPLSRAVADGDRIYAVVRGTAVNQDGRTNGLMAPNPRSQEEVLRQAWRRADASPSDAQYVEAHGTGTLLGDPIEAKALGRVFSERRPPGRSCSIGSVKTNVGHLEAAAGMAALIKTALAIRHREIPPSLHFEQPNPHIPFADLRLSVQRELAPWPDGPALAGVSAFGFGGTNAHAVLAAAPEQPALDPLPPPHLLPLSAHLPAALTERARSLLALADASVADLAFTTARRSHHRHRLAVVAHDGEDLRAALEAFVRGDDSPNGFAGQDEDARGPVFVMTGQGPQCARMGLGLAAREPVFRAVLHECDRLVSDFAGWSLLAELEAPAEHSRLTRTEFAQPALFAVQTALAALWRHWGVQPSAVVGHSAGEVAAAHVAGVLTLEEAVRLAVERGRTLERAAAGGRMAQVELPESEARKELAGLEDRVVIAAINAPASTVISGEPSAVEELLARLHDRGIAGRILTPGAYAFHSPRIEPFLDEFASALDGLAPRAASVPLYSTVTGAAADGREWNAGYWRRQARQPVRFADAVNALIAQGHRRFLELGPHPVLSPSISAAGGIAFASLRRGQPEIDTLLHSLAALYVQGQPVDWRRFHARGGSAVALPAYPWQRERCWADGSASRPARLAAGAHPLLGSALELASPRHRWVWERDLGGRDLPFLEDHRVEGAMVVPATAYLEMAVAASARASGELPAALADVRFVSPMVIPDNGSRRVQVVLNREEDGNAGFQIFSRIAGSEWSLHASGRIHQNNGDGPPEVVDIDGLRRRCPDVIDGTDLYPRLFARGLQYGPAFQGIGRLWRGSDESLGEVKVPAQLLPDLASYHLHPAVLDACGQAVAAAGAGDRAMVPVALDELRLHGRPGERLWSHTWQSETGPGTVVGNGRLLDEDGRVVAEARGMRLRALDGGRESSPADWMYELQWERILLPEMAATAAPGGWLIFADDGGVGDELAARLSGRGERCAVVFAGSSWQQLPDGRYRVLPGEAEHMRRLLDDLIAAGWPPLRGVIHLWSLDAPADTTIATLEEAERRGCGAALPLAQELLLHGGPTPPRIWLVTRGAQAAGEHRIAAAQAPLWGFGRSLAQEHPALWGGLVDLDPEEAPDASGGRLAHQVLASGDEVQVAWRSGVAYGARLKRRRDLWLHDVASHGWRVDGTYLVTGGLGGLGLEVARWMAAQGARRLILLGRTQLPPRSGWTDVDPASRTGRHVAAIRELESRGAAVHLAPLDIADENALTGFLETFRREGWPPICGIVHAAGVLQDQAVLQLDAAALTAVFRAKVLGGWLLHRLVDEPLDFFVLFSSAAALLGSAGQANYAAANSFLDALAHLRRAEGKPASSLAWGPWAGVGMAEERGERFGRRGISSIPTAQGLEILERLLAHRPVHAGIVPVDWERLLAAFPAYRNAPLLRGIVEERSAVHDDGKAANTLAALRAAKPEERLQRLQALLAEQVGRVVGLPAAQLDPLRPMNDLGVDSLMAAELKARVERELGVSVPIVRLIESPSLAGFAAILLEQIEGTDRPAPAPQKPLSVALQPKGARRPFFFVHPGALGVQCYDPLIHAIGDEQPFWALQPSELDGYSGETGTEGTLDEAAARCVQALCDLQPSGPYLVGGWSIGGVVAWLVARRLAAEGKEVAHLLLLDAPAPPPGGEAPRDYDDRRLMPVFARYLGARLSRSLDPAPNERELLRAAIEMGVVPRNYDEAQLLDLLRVFKSGLLRSVRQLWACPHGTASFPITLLRPHDRLEAFDDLFPDPAARWKELTSATLDVREVPGDHYTLFLPEHAAELAAEMRRAFDSPMTPISPTES